MPLDFCEGGTVSTVNVLGREPPNRETSSRHFIHHEMEINLSDLLNDFTTEREEES